MHPQGRGFYATRRPHRGRALQEVPGSGRPASPAGWYPRATARPAPCSCTGRRAPGSSVSDSESAMSRGARPPSFRGSRRVRSAKVRKLPPLCTPRRGPFAPGGRASRRLGERPSGLGRRSVRLGEPALALGETPLPLGGRPSPLGQTSLALGRRRPEIGETSWELGEKPRAMGETLLANQGAPKRPRSLRSRKPGART
jgi:hypothetical protein